MKACGLGINLVMANHVFFLDPWWNPFIFFQCIDRTHRIGQKKTVFVYQFIIKNTIEYRIMQLQEMKKQIADNALGKLLIIIN